MAGLEDLRIVRTGNHGGRAKSKWLLALFGIASTVGAGSLLYANLTTHVEVSTIRVSAGTRTNGSGPGVVLNATGYIVAAHYIELASKVVGRVSWTGVERGDRVEAGQELVRLESEEYRAQLMQSQGSLDSLRAKLAELENGSRPEEVLKSQADLEQARADLENCRVALSRTRQLADAGVIARQALDDAQAKYDGAAARTRSLERVHEIVQRGPRAEQIQAMRAQVSQAQGAVNYARTQVDNTVIRAPISGTILERNVDRGEFVTTGFVGDRGAKGYVVSMANLEDLQVELDVSQADFARLKPRQQATITVEAYPGRSYDGFIEEVAPEANRQKATVQVKVRVVNPDSVLRPEMSASVAFRSPHEQVKSAAPAVSVPAEAVRDGKVFVVAGGKAFRRDSATLSGGEEIIIRPPVELVDGQKVKVK